MSAEERAGKEALDVFGSLPSVSIDYAVMELSPRVAVIPAGPRLERRGLAALARDLRRARRQRHRSRGQGSGHREQGLDRVLHRPPCRDARPQGRHGRRHLRCHARRVEGPGARRAHGGRGAQAHGGTRGHPAQGVAAALGQLAEPARRAQLPDQADRSDARLQALAAEAPPPKRALDRGLGHAPAWCATRRRSRST